MDLLPQSMVTFLTYISYQQRLSIYVRGARGPRITPAPYEKCAWPARSSKIQARTLNQTSNPTYLAFQLPRHIDHKQL